MTQDNYPPPDVAQRNLTGLCCECCHGRCAAAGGSFPHTSLPSNLFITPIQFANLARLGHESASTPAHVVWGEKTLSRFLFDLF